MHVSIQLYELYKELSEWKCVARITAKLLECPQRIKGHMHMHARTDVCWGYLRSLPRTSKKPTSGEASGL